MSWCGSSYQGNMLVPETMPDEAGRCASAQATSRRSDDSLCRADLWTITSCDTSTCMSISLILPTHLPMLDWLVSPSTASACTSAFLWGGGGGGERERGEGGGGRGVKGITWTGIARPGLAQVGCREHCSAERLRRRQGSPAAVPGTHHLSLAFWRLQRPLHPAAGTSLPPATPAPYLSSVPGTAVWPLDLPAPHVQHSCCAEELCRLCTEQAICDDFPQFASLSVCNGHSMQVKLFLCYRLAACEVKDWLCSTYKLT